MTTEWWWGNGGKVSFANQDGMRSMHTPHIDIDVEHLVFDHGFDVCIPRVDIKKRCTLSSQTTYDAARITIIFRLLGTNNIRLTDCIDVPVGDGQLIILSPREHTFHYTFPKAGGLRAFEFNMSADALYRLLGEDIPVEFQPFLCDAPTQSKVIHFQTTPEMRAMAQFAMTSGTASSLRRMEVEGLFLMLLAQMSAQAGSRLSGKLANVGARRTRDAAMDAYARIMANIDGTHTAGSLAGAVGISERRLNQAFHDVFGVSVFQKLKNERMAEARRILEQEDVRLKQISHRVGYTQVTSFIRAFTSHFGVPPKQFSTQSSNDIIESAQHPEHMG